MLPEDPLATSLADVRRATRDQVTAVWQAQMDRIRDLLSRDWREQMGRIIDDRLTEFESSLKPRILESRREVVRSFGRHWNESFIRMRAAESDREWCDALLDAAAGLVKRGVFFSVKGEAIYYQGARGFEPALRDVPAELPVQAAPAFLEVVLSGLPAETTRTARDLSAPLADCLGDPDGKALLVPILADDRVVGVLYAENTLEQAALEAIAMVAGIILARRLQTAEPPRPSTIMKAMLTEEEPETPSEAVRKVTANPRAEKAARVAVSRLLLAEYAGVRAGRLAGDVYSPLQPAIDRLRGEFDHPIEYLDAELLRSLAQGKPELVRR